MYTCLMDSTERRPADWMLFPDRIARERALLDYGADGDTVLRAKRWAVLLAVMLLDTGIQDHPQHKPIATPHCINYRRTLPDGIGPGSQRPAAG